jgi:hypothetical protein
MRLTEAQQERYARHLLLDELGGEGQERLLASCVRVRGTGTAVRWAARYLAASGVGTLIVDDGGAAAECRELSPDVRVLTSFDFAPARDPDLDLSLHLDLNPPYPAERGAAAALAAVRQLVRP